MAVRSLACPHAELWFTCACTFAPRASIGSLAVLLRLEREGERDIPVHPAGGRASVSMPVCTASARVVVNHTFTFTLLF